MRSRAIASIRPLRAQNLGWRTQILPQYRFQQRRLQSQLITLRDGTELRRQDVIFKGPKVFSFRRFVTILGYTFGIYYTLKYVPKLAGFDIQVELDDAGAEEGDEKERSKRLQEGAELTDEDLEVDEGSLFLPMTWAEALPREYYQGSDPEWQEFIKISNDTARQRGIWQLMIASFMMFANQTGIIVRRLGGDVKPGKHWLDMTFPDGPPVQYVRHGLEFGDGFIAWSRQRIEAEKQHRIARALWPTAMFSSAYASARVYTIVQWNQLKSFLGFEAASKDGSWDQHFKQAAADFNERKKLMKRQADPAGTAPTLGSSASSPASETASKALWPLPALPLPAVSLSGQGEVDPASDLKHTMAAQAFAKTLMKNWSSKDKVPPRGTFLVHGLIELRGKKGRMLFDVVGVFDPKQNKYVDLRANVKQFKAWKQTPKGGS